MSRKSLLSKGACTGTKAALSKCERHRTSTKGMNMKSVTQAVVLGTLMIGLTTSSVFAGEGNFKKNHPRRAEVVGRANHEEKKNEAAEESGKITKKQENRLNRQDEAIKKEEQADAAANGGHITKAEQKKLNREENKVDRERARMEKRDAAKAGGVAPTAPSAPAAPTAGTTH